MSTTPPTIARVAVVPWPTGVATRARARARAQPCLLLVDVGAAPPSDCGPLEDWARSDAVIGDVARRIETLEGRPATAPRLAASVVAELTDDQVLLFDLLDRRPGCVTPWEAVIDALPATDPGCAVTSLHNGLRQAGFVVLRVSGGLLMAEMART
jgi:hypothetical protein